VLTLVTNPAGLTVSVDGQPGTTPDSFASVVGMARAIAVPPIQVLAGNIYQFTGWSDGNAAGLRVVATPPADSTFLALYQFIGIVPPVTLLGASEQVRRGSVQRIILTFSDALDPAAAQVPTAYWLALPGRDHRFGTRDDRRIRIRTASYHGATHTVTLRPRSVLSSRMSFQVVVSGSSTSAAVRDVWGRPIDGDRDGQPGGNALALVRPARGKAR
jgi:hypothetical protein